MRPHFGFRAGRGKPRTSPTRRRLRSHADVVFPGEGEDGEQVGEDEEVADFLVEAA